MANRLQRSWWKHSVRKSSTFTRLAKRAGAVLYLDARKADGLQNPTNSPLTNAWVDLLGNKTNYTLTNVSGVDGNFGTDSNSDGLADGFVSGGSTSLSVSSNVQKFTPTAQGGNIAYAFSTYATGSYYYVCAYVKSSTATTRVRLKDNAGSIQYTGTSTTTGVFEFISAYGSITSDVLTWKGWVDSGLTSNWGEIEVKLFHMIDVTALYGAGNEPPKSYLDWLFQSKISSNGYINSLSFSLSNSYIPTNMAGTTASGVDVSTPRKAFWMLDGTDDYFSAVKTSFIDITSSPLAVFTTIYLPSSSQNGSLFVINTDATANTQFAMIYDNSTAKMYAWLDGASKGSSAALSTDTWYNIGFIWDGTTVKYYINGVNGGTNGSYSGSLTQRGRFRIGARASSATASTAYFKGRMATLTIYTGSNCVEGKVLASEKSISSAYFS